MAAERLKGRGGGLPRLRMASERGGHGPVARRVSGWLHPTTRARACSALWRTIHFSVCFF